MGWSIVSTNSSFLLLSSVELCLCPCLGYLRSDHTALLLYATILILFTVVPACFDTRARTTTQDAPLGALGLDSMEAMQLMALLEERFGVSCTHLRHVAPGGGRKARKRQNRT